MNPIFNINAWISELLPLSRGLWCLIAAVLFAILCVLFLSTVRRGRVKARTTFIETGWTALWYWGLLLLSLLTYWPFGEKKALLAPGNPMAVWLIAALVVSVLYVWYFRKRKKHFADQVSATAIRKSAAGSGASKYCYALLFAGMLVCSVICLARLIAGDSIFHLLVPMLAVIITLLLYNLTHWRLWFALGSLAILVYAFLMIQSFTALKGFAYTPLVAMVPLYLSAILPLGSLALIKQK